MKSSNLRHRSRSDSAPTESQMKSPVDFRFPRHDGPLCQISPLNPGLGYTDTPFPASELRRSAEAGCQQCVILNDALLCFHRVPCNVRLGLLEDKSLWVQHIDRGWLIEIFTADDYSSTIYPYLKFRLNAHIDPSGNTSSGKSLRHALNWIRECTRSHGSCGPGLPQRLPTRVLDVSGPIVRLFHSDGEFARYACLSHCWGDQQYILRTTIANVDQFCDHISVDLIPKTFRDAISFTRSLGLRWLWIDSLCIIQDDDSVPSDWQKESAKMTSVYQNAYVTIAAASEGGPRAGCFTTTEDRLQARLRIGNGDSSEGPSIYACLDRAHIVDQRDRGRFPILQRAWVFQERLLSSRIIYFCGDELQWECRKSAHCECGAPTDWRSSPKLVFARQTLGDDPASTGKAAWCFDSSLSGGNSSKPFMPSFMPSSWHEILRSYTRLQLTYESDILPALAGIAKAWSQKTGDKYYAGLWESTFVHDLLWYATGPASRRTFFTRHAPSWSWASADWSEFRGYNHRSDSGVPPGNVVNGVEISEVACNPVGTDPFGQIQSGYLVLSCRAVTGLAFKEGVDIRLLSHSVWFNDEGFNLDVVPMLDNTTGSAIETNVISVYILPLLETCVLHRPLSVKEDHNRQTYRETGFECLIVRRQAGAGGDAEEETYERCGHAHLSPDCIGIDRESNFIALSSRIDVAWRHEAYRKFASQVSEAPIRTFKIY